MPGEESHNNNFAKVIQELCERSSAPLSVEEQRRRYRRRRKLPDWVWGVVVGLLVSAAVVVAMVFSQ